METNITYSHNVCTFLHTVPWLHSLLSPSNIRKLVEHAKLREDYDVHFTSSASITMNYVNTLRRSKHIYIDVTDLPTTSSSMHRYGALDIGMYHTYGRAACTNNVLYDTMQSTSNTFREFLKCRCKMYCKTNTRPTVLPPTASR